MFLAAASFAQMAPSEGKYMGPGSCGASACHGSVKPLSTTRVLQNEYSIWVVQDSHARAFRSLENPVSQRMGRILGIGDPTRAHKCLVCHSLDVAPAQKGRQFDPGDGVSCESCHGPASEWLGPHTLATQQHEQNVRLGMTDLRDLVSRSQLCLSCHMGDTEKQVDHEMIAAGHPDLVFELDSYSAIMPPHWKPSDNPDFGLRDWSVGQAVELRDSLRRLARHANSGQWLEYSDLDCFSCHHSLTDPADSWRQERGYGKRTPGVPPWNASHFAVFRILAQQMDSSASRDLDEAMDEVYKATSHYTPQTHAVAEAAGKAGNIADEMVERMKTAHYDRALSAHLLAGLSDRAAQLSNDDTRTAEQAAMAVDALYISYSRQGGQSPAVRSAIDGLFTLLKNPSAYNAPQFRAQMEKVSAALEQAGVR